MEPEDSLQRLLELAPAPTPRCRFSLPAGAGAAAAASPVGGGASRPASAGSALRSSLAKELSALDQMFGRWQEDAAAKRAAAAAARDFPEPESFSLALLVLNKRGELRRGTRVAQSWYFVPRRQASSAAGELPCSRCCVGIRRRETYFVDRAAREWRLADEVCRGCMLCVMRSLLGEDDAAILSEAQAILGSAWQPTVDAALAEALQGERRRNRLAEL